MYVHMFISWYKITTGYASVPASRGFNAHQQSEFATVAGGNYRGAPNMRNGPNYYPREQFDRQQGYRTEQRQYQHDYNGIRLQSPVRGGAHMSAPPTNQSGAQEVKRSNQQSKPVIKSKQELSKYTV